MPQFRCGGCNQFVPTLVDYIRCAECMERSVTRALYLHTVPSIHQAALLRNTSYRQPSPVDNQDAQGIKSQPTVGQSTPNAPRKICRDCRESKESSEFRKDSKTADGQRRECKVCSRLRTARVALKPPALLLERVLPPPAPDSALRTGIHLDGRKLCRRCGGTFELTMFRHESKSRDGYRVECKRCSIARDNPHGVPRSAATKSA